MKSMAGDRSSSGGFACLRAAGRGPGLRRGRGAAQKRRQACWRVAALQRHTGQAMMQRLLGGAEKGLTCANTCTPITQRGVRRAVQRPRATCQLGPRSGRALPRVRTMHGTYAPAEAGKRDRISHGCRTASQPAQHRRRRGSSCAAGATAWARIHEPHTRSCWAPYDAPVRLAVSQSAQHDVHCNAGAEVQAPCRAGVGWCCSSPHLGGLRRRRAPCDWSRPRRDKLCLAQSSGGQQAFENSPGAETGCAFCPDLCGGWLRREELGRRPAQRALQRAVQDADIMSVHVTRGPAQQRQAPGGADRAQGLAGHSRMQGEPNHASVGQRRASVGRVTCAEGDHAATRTPVAWSTPPRTRYKAPR